MPTAFPIEKRASSSGGMEVSAPRLKVRNRLVVIQKPYAERMDVCFKKSFPCVPVVLRLVRIYRQVIELLQILCHMRFDQLIQHLVHFRAAGNHIAGRQVIVVERKVGNDPACFFN